MYARILFLFRAVYLMPNWSENDELGGLFRDDLSPLNLASSVMVTLELGL